MTIKVRLQDESIVEVKSFVVEGNDGIIEDFPSFNTAKEYEDNQKKEKLNIFLNDFLWFSSDQRFIEDYIKLDKSLKQTFIKLLQDFTE